MYKGGRGSEGGGNRNYFNAIKYRKWFYIDKEHPFSQTEEELSRFAQNTKFHLFFNLLPAPSLAITMCMSQASGLERAST